MSRYETLIPKAPEATTTPKKKGFLGGLFKKKEKQAVATLPVEKPIETQGVVSSRYSKLIPITEEQSAVTTPIVQESRYSSLVPKVETALPEQEKSPSMFKNLRKDVKERVGQGLIFGAKTGGSQVVKGINEYNKWFYNTFNKGKGVGGESYEPDYEKNIQKVKEYEKKSTEKLVERLGEKRANSFITQASAALGQGGLQIAAFSVNPVVGYTTIAGQTVGAGKSAYDEALAATGDKKIARINGIVTGSVNSLEALPVFRLAGIGKDLLSKPVKTGALAVGKRLAEATLLESGTEAISEGASSLTRKLTYDKGATPLRDAINAFLVSIPTGILFGGAGEVNIQSRLRELKKASSGIKKSLEEAGVDKEKSGEVADIIVNQYATLGDEDIFTGPEGEQVPQKENRYLALTPEEKTPVNRYTSLIQKKNETETPTGDYIPTEVGFHGTSNGKLSVDKQGNINFSTESADSVKQFAGDGKVVDVPFDKLNIKRVNSEKELFDEVSTGKDKNLSEGIDIVFYQEGNRAIGINREKISQVSNTPLSEDIRTMTIKDIEKLNKPNLRPQGDEALSDAKPDQSLFQEARKYETMEEFVNKSKSIYNDNLSSDLIQYTDASFQNENTQREFIRAKSDWNVRALQGTKDEDIYTKITGSYGKAVADYVFDAIKYQKSQLEEIWKKANKSENFGINGGDIGFTSKSEKSRQKRIDSFLEAERRLDNYVGPKPTQPKVEPLKKLDTKKIETLENELINAYSKYKDAQSELEKITIEMELSKPGERIFDTSGVGTKVSGVPSTFPKWLPDKLKSTELFKKMMVNISNIDSIKFPRNPRAINQRLLINEVMGKLDTQLGVDTSGIRADILEIYDSYNKGAEVDNKRAGRDTGRGESKPERSEQQSKQLEKIKDEIAQLEKELENGMGFDGELSDKDRERLHKTIESLKETLGLPSYTGGQSGADIGLFADGTPVEMGNMDKIRPIEFPELVDIARELTGNVPFIKKMRDEKRGFFRAGGKGEISLNPKIFEDVDQATKTLAHEIGHLIDYLPDQTLKRGNLLGRLKTLRGFMGETFGTESSMLGEREGPLNEDRRRQLKNRATKDVLSKRNMKFGDLFSKDITVEQRKEINKEISVKTKEYVDELLEKEGYIKNQTVRDELMKVTAYWRPYDPKTSSKSYNNYRKSSKELYADAISMLFNTPGTLEKMAPTFYKEFFDALDKKPAVFNAYFDLQSLLSGDKNTILERRRAGVRKMFDEGDYKASELQKVREAEKKKRENNILFRLKFELLEKNEAVMSKIRDLQKKGIIINDDDNPTYYLEERNYLAGKIKNIMDVGVNPIYQNLQKEGISWTDFGEALFYERIRAGDRSDVANPRGITPKVAEELLTKMFQDMGVEKSQILVANMESFRTTLRSVAEEAHAEGLYSDELYQQMQENPAYVTFQVIDHIDKGMTSKVHKSLGTLKDITNPADASLLKLISTVRAIERNKVNRSVIELWNERFSQEIKPAQTKFVGKAKIPVESRLPNEELVTYMDKGKVQGYYVDPYIKASLDNESIGHNNAVVSILRKGNSGMFRPLFIGLNLGFQSFNFVRDFLRLYKNVPNITLIGAMKRYHEAMPAAKYRVFGLKDESNATLTQQKARGYIQEMEKEQILSITYNDVISGQSEEDRQIDTILEKSGINTFKEPVKHPIVRPLLRVLNAIKNLGDIIETIPKVAGYLELSEGGTKELSKSEKSYIRKNIGSPDFLAGGRSKPIFNEVFLFSNSIAQGYRSDINVATDPKTRGAYWWKTVKINIIPKILMFGAVMGLFGDEVEDEIKGVSSYDMTNYLIIPFGKDENGKTVYLRAPQDEGGRFIGALFWKMLTATGNDKTAWQDISEALSFLGGQVPSTTPTITTTSAIAQYLYGQNPYDTFRGRNVLSEDQFKAGPKYSLKPFAGWVFNQIGGGIFYRFYNESTPREKTTTEKVFNLPVLGNIIGRFIRVSDYGKTERLNVIKKSVESEKAQTRIEENKTINDYIKKAQDNPDIAIRTLELELVQEVFGRRPQGDTETQRAKNIIKKFNIGLKRGEQNIYLNSLISAGTNDAKVELLKEIKSQISAEEYQALKEDAIKNKIVNTLVFAKVEKELREASE